MSPSTRPIQRLLVANRGEIACRIFATCRRLGIATVAVYSDPDTSARHVHEADVAVGLGGASAAESYLQATAIIDAAHAATADAIHPGYGFLSENAEFARAVIEAGLTWVGPEPDVIAAMGSKLRAREIMEAAGVPVLPGGAVAHLDPAELEALAVSVGFPLLVKASAGGGGRGMRRVDDLEALDGAVQAASRAAEAAFGDGSVFLERLVSRPRHLEVQILGDQHGQIAVLPERDCSLQRRHQKIVEESPAPSLDDNVRSALADAARSAATTLAYTSAGTVEFVLTPDGEVFFLEVNTRLQVEHPVTELVCGLDLVELQLCVAAGEPLPAEALTPTITGHAIEARLVAEDPAAGWIPQTGLWEQFSFGCNVRVDAGIEAGTEISPYYDSLVAKVIAHAPTREAASRKLADALRRARLAGPATNRDLLVRVVSSATFSDVKYHTQYLEDEDISELLAPLAGGEDERLAAAVATLASQAGRRAESVSLGGMPSGWRNVGKDPQHAAYSAPSRTELEVRYRFDRRGEVTMLDVNGETLSVRLHGCSADYVDLEVDAQRESYEVFEGASAVWVGSSRGQVRLVEQPRFPSIDAVASSGSLAAPMPGTIIRVLAREGDQVRARQPLVVLEAMKMEHEIVSPTDGVIEHLTVAVGDHVQAGQTITVVTA
jgi:acetyl/propionyl-CoA carboxylase alpha subunit